MEVAEAQVQQSKRLLDEALALLKDKAKNCNDVKPGLEFHIENTMTQLKVGVLMLNKTYFCLFSRGGGGGVIFEYCFCKVDL